MALMDTEKTISRPGNGPTMDEKTLIKIPVTLQEAEALTTEARQALIPERTGGFWSRLFGRG